MYLNARHFVARRTGVIGSNRGTRRSVRTRLGAADNHPERCVCPGPTKSTLPRRGSTISAPAHTQGVLRSLACFVHHPRGFAFHFSATALRSADAGKSAKSAVGRIMPNFVPPIPAHRDPAGQCHVESHVDTQLLDGSPRVTDIEDLAGNGEVQHGQYFLRWCTAVTNRTDFTF